MANAGWWLQGQPAEHALTWPGFAGSRSGALIATAWASMLHLGNEGFLRTTAQIMQARPCPCTFASGDREVPVPLVTGGSRRRGGVV